MENYKELIQELRFKFLDSSFLNATSDEDLEKFLGNIDCEVEVHQYRSEKMIDKRLVTGSLDEVIKYLENYREEGWTELCECVDDREDTYFTACRIITETRDEYLIRILGMLKEEKRKWQVEKNATRIKELEDELRRLRKGEEI